MVSAMLHDRDGWGMGFRSKAAFQCFANHGDCRFIVGCFATSIRIGSSLGARFAEFVINGV